MFKVFDIDSCPNQDFTNSNFPSFVQSWSNSKLLLGENASHFGYVYQGIAILTYEKQTYTLQEGMYFCVPNNAKIVGKGLGLVISRIGVNSLFSIGGKVEQKGRLKYIDECYDTLLISPTVLGDPCLNFMSMPTHIDQSNHTHPSLRVGIILSGKGICKTPQGDFELSEGKVFVMEKETEHSFHTDKQELRLLTYHPDSDFGPSNDSHPMLNRTLIDNISASQLEDKKTK
jgi:quercetin dioxygenase-like cupin family protein